MKRFMLSKKMKQIIKTCSSKLVMIPMFKTYARSNFGLTNKEKLKIIHKNTIGKYEGENK